jgi:hypothetical protein
MIGLMADAGDNFKNLRGRQYPSRPVHYRQCLSRILIFTHPGSRILDPKTAAKERGEKKFVVIPIYVATSFTKLKIILVLKC